MQLNAAAELVRLPIPFREEKARYALARTALTQYDAMIAAGTPTHRLRPTSSGRVLIVWARCTPAPSTRRSSANTKARSPSSRPFPTGPSESVHRLNAAAELVRLADTPSREEKARYALARTALTQYDAMIAAGTDPQAAPDIIRARIDRLGALYASAEYAQVIREYQSLIAQQQTVPDWAIGWSSPLYRP